MRKIGFVILALAAAAWAQTPLTGTEQCPATPAQRQTIAVPGESGHQFVISQSNCTFSPSSQIAGVALKSSVDTSFQELWGQHGWGSGYVVIAMDNGDTVTVRFEVQIARTGVASVKWHFMSGTGKFKGIGGSGTVQSTGGPQGYTNQIEGSYTLPTAASH